MTGLSDSQPAIMAMLSVAEQYGTAIIQFPHNSTLRCDGGLLINTNKIGIDWRGSTVDFSHMREGYAIRFKQDEADVNKRPLRNAAHPIMNARLVGPGPDSNVGGMLMKDAGANLSGLKMRNLAFENFSTDVVLDVGTFCASFESCSFTQTSGPSGAGYSITIANGNNGERNSFTDCFWFNRPLQINALSSNSDTYFSNCSFDTFTTAFNVVAGMVFLNNCHIEGTADSAVWGFTGPGATLFVANTTIISQADKTAFDIFFSVPGNPNGGVFLDKVFFELGEHRMLTRLIGGDGNARATHIVQPTNTARPVIGGMLNLLAYGGFEHERYANDWQFSGSILPSRVNSPVRNGAWSLQLRGNAATAASPSSASAIRACSPGQYMQGEMWLLIPSIRETGASFYYAVLYLDAAKEPIGNSGNAVSVSTDLKSWTHTVLAADHPAPAGTVWAELVLTMNSPAKGESIAYVDDVILNVF